MAATNPVRAQVTRRLVFAWRTPPLTDSSRVIVEIAGLSKA